jgi:hypothetical protein
MAIAFGCVVVDNVQQHFNTRVMAGGDQVDASHRALAKDRLLSSSRGGV